MAALADDVPADDDAAPDVAVDVMVDADGTPVVRITGEIDVATADEVRARMISAIAGRPARVAIEMSGVEFMDSSGIAVLLEIAGLAEAIEIRRPSPAVQRVIEATGLTDVLPIGG